MRAFVTGVAGFAGSHLAEHLVAEGWEVAGVLAPGEDPRALTALGDQVALTELDIADAEACTKAVLAARPTCIFHLAAIAFVPESLDAPIRTYDVNVGGTLNLLEVLRTRCPETRLICVGSGDAYGDVRPEELPITEAQPWRAVNPYAATKAAADVLAGAYAQQYGLAVVRARPFNHTGPRQSPRFVCADFARQLALIEAQRHAPVLRVGRLSARRDFSDVRDVARAYAMLANPDVPADAYNIASGTGVPVRDILSHLCRLCALPVRVEEEPARLRPLEIPEHRGSASRLHRETGWRPLIPLEQTLQDTLDYWRQHVAHAVGRGR